MVDLINVNGLGPIFNPLKAVLLGSEFLNYFSIIAEVMFI